MTGGGRPFSIEVVEARVIESSVPDPARNIVKMVTRLPDDERLEFTIRTHNRHNRGNIRRLSVVYLTERSYSHPNAVHSSAETGFRSIERGVVTLLPSLIPKLKFKRKVFLIRNINCAFDGTLSHPQARSLLHYTDTWGSIILDEDDVTLARICC